MSFFVTSVGMGNGGDLGGLAGADAHCRALATAVGARHPHVARISQHAGTPRSARGQRPRPHRHGPLVQRQGRRDLADQSELHGDTLVQAQRGSNLFKQSALNEKGEVVHGVGDPLPNVHDMLTGSQPDGRAFPERSGPHLQQLDVERRGLGAGRPLRSHRRRQHVVELVARHDRAAARRTWRAGAAPGLFYCFAAN